ncbi:S1 family peptidase [Streptomyces lonarensis]|uniref:S1 family peptidase n=1 Tax=Streptomyces lonarensis TaxID=700599 RepID=A0A7X6HY18_9ACTN|nr:S1 family peptidase [Streptomyces lonarensis]NJQ05156.1 S1 family peptidase [Streptomyces lonarensis]
MRHTGRNAIGAAIAASALAFALVPSQASANDTMTERAEAAVADLPAGVLDAMERDLGLSEQEAGLQLVAEHDASLLGETLSADLDAFAGSWLTEGTELVVATTSEAEAAEITEAGATAEVVDHTLAELDSVKDALDQAAESYDTTDAPVWYVDVTTNGVVLLTSDVTEAEGFVEAAGVNAAAVDIQTSDEQPQAFYDLVGGDAYYMGGGRCSVGFSVTQGSTPGFATAGHCGTVGTSTTGYNQAAQGTFEESSFPGDDMAWVSVNSDWNTTPTVNEGEVTVSGSTEAAVGASVCRSGSTTGWHCGTIQQHNTSVTYPEGTITGVTRTSVCAEPGDSGGSYISGSQAQGVTSGGSGNCTSGGTTYHQPINPLLSAYGLDLVTG